MDDLLLQPVPGAPWRRRPSSRLLLRERDLEGKIPPDAVLALIAERPGWWDAGGKLS